VRCDRRRESGGVGVGVHLPSAMPCCAPGSGGGAWWEGGSASARARPAAGGPWPAASAYDRARLRLKDMQPRTAGAPVAERRTRLWLECPCWRRATPTAFSCGWPEPTADGCAFRAPNRCCGCIARPQAERVRGAAWAPSSSPRRVESGSVARDNGSNTPCRW